MDTEKINLYNASSTDLSSAMADWGQPAFRARQVYRQLYTRYAGSIEEMTDLPVELRERMIGESILGTMELVDVRKGDQGLTRKAIWRLPGGETIESVLMIYPDRATVCVSSQAGCPMGCVFCATARLGFLQNLSPGDMVQQVIWAAREIQAMKDQPVAKNTHRVRPGNFPPHLTNVVFMGMGEPFNNYDNWWASVERLHDPDGFNLGARSFTVSTVGLIPGIEKLMEAPLPVNLAISLHTAYDERRSALMPVNRRYPIADLIAASRAYAARTGRRVSFEYCLIAGENDSADEAEALANLLLEDRFPCHVNLIPWNPVAGTGLARSTRASVNTFKALLDGRAVPCSIRIQRGMDIDAACGQLAGSYVEKE
jgi:23S rRNA (adenine2503-C2)-methyltransferase